MKIVGIDPGLQVCGYACIELTDEGLSLVEAGAIRTDSKRTLEERLTQVAEDVDSVLESFSPEVVAIEKLYSHYKHPTTAVLMGHARGVIIQRCGARGIKVEDLQATRIKKSLTGNGRATKEQMQLAVQSALSLPCVPEPNDVADAIAIGLCYANIYQRKVLTND